LKDFILLTGATGFIGSHVANKLLEDQSFQIVAIVRTTKARGNIESLAAKGAIVVEGTFYDKALLETVFRDYPVKYVIHLAAIRGEGSGTKEDYHKVNVLGTEVLLEASLRNGVNRFIFCSSIGVFGAIPRTLPGNLMSPLNGDNLYHLSKMLAEEKVRDFMHRGLDTCIVRPSITYGEGDDGFPLKLVELIRKRFLPLTRKSSLIHLLDVKKLVDVFTRLLIVDDLNQRILIVADKEPILLRELADLVYSHYYGKKYLVPFTLPEFFLTALLFILKTCGSKKWLTRLRLISQSWYYDTKELASLSGFTLSDTKTEFVKFLKTLRVA
jgi:nucleoside-diphosphate-sugar epimerase